MVRAPEKAVLFVAETKEAFFHGSLSLLGGQSLARTPSTERGRAGKGGHAVLVDTSCYGFAASFFFFFSFLFSASAACASHLTASLRTQRKFHAPPRRGVFADVRL